MRRKDRQTTTEEAMQVLHHAEYGFLSTTGADGLPYGVPLSFVVMGDEIGFHCARAGRKTDNLSHCPKVAFCAVGATKPIYDGNFTTYFESVMVQGVARRLENPQEKTRWLMALCEKYLPLHMEKAPKEIGASLEATDFWCISIEEITGKAKRPKQ